MNEKEECDCSDNDICKDKYLLAYECYVKNPLNFHKNCNKKITDLKNCYKKENNWNLFGFFKYLLNK